MSHSLRSAWIEIIYDSKAEQFSPPSHSLRSAWIEIEQAVNFKCIGDVALLTECVDRNPAGIRNPDYPLGRTPYGVRG